MAGIITFGMNISLAEAFASGGSRRIHSHKSSESWPVYANRKTESRVVDGQTSKEDNYMFSIFQNMNNGRSSMSNNGKDLDPDTSKAYNVIEMIFATSMETEDMATSSKSVPKLAEDENIKDILLLVGLCWCVDERRPYLCLC